MHPARRRRRRYGLARTRDGRAARPERPGRRSGRGRSLTRRARRGLLLSRRLRFLSHHPLGGRNAAAGGDSHLGLRRRLSGDGRRGRSLRRFGLPGVDCRRLDGLALRLVGLRRHSRNLGRLFGRGGLDWLDGGGLDVGLRGRRLLDLDHRRRRRLQQAVALCPSPDAVGLGFHDARRVGLDPDTERETEFERLLVGQPELLGELMDADLAWQRVPPSGLLRAVTWSGNVPRTRRPRIPKPIDVARSNVSPKGPPESATAPGRVEAGDVGAQPGSPPRSRPEPQLAARGHANSPHLRARAAGATADAGPDRTHKPHAGPRVRTGLRRGPPARPASRPRRRRRLRPAPRPWRRPRPRR